MPLAKIWKQRESQPSMSTSTSQSQLQKDGCGQENLRLSDLLTYRGIFCDTSSFILSSYFINMLHAIQQCSIASTELCELVCFFPRFFDNLNSILWKNYVNFLTLPQTTRSNGYVMGCGKLRNQSKIAPGGLSKRENILSHEITLYHTVQMVLVDPCDKLIICFLWLIKGGKHNYWCQWLSIIIFTTL